MIRRRQGPAGAVLVAAGAALGFAAAAAAGTLDDVLRSRWLGAWVLIRSEVGSDCGSLFTNNRVLEGRVIHDGEILFSPGELGRVVKLDAKRMRVDVFVELSEPVRVSRMEGPFQLFDQLTCRVELQVGVPRPLIRGGDAVAISGILAAVVERHDSSEAASSSPAWNRRRVEPLPAGYEETLGEYREWRERRLVEGLHDRLDEALDEAADIVERARRSAPYSEGLAEGLRSRRSGSLGRDCESLVDARIYPSSEKAPEGYEDRDRRDWEAGYRDAQRLVFAIELADRLELCLR